MFPKEKVEFIDRKTIFMFYSYCIVKRAVKYLFWPKVKDIHFFFLSTLSIVLVSKWYEIEKIGQFGCLGFPSTFQWWKQSVSSRKVNQGLVK